MSSSRRDFLKSVVGASTVVSLAPTVPAFLNRTALAARSTRDTADTVLIVVQLSGGNDGLNTVVPYADDAYGRSRRTLRLTGSQVHKIDSLLGFHPQMQGFARLFQEGQLSVVQGVGYPKSNRSHPGAMRDWHTARPGEATCQTGWLGRAIDLVDRPDEADVPGVFVARIPKPFALNAKRAIVPRIRTAQQWTLSTTPGTGNGRDLPKSVASSRDDEDNPLLDFVRRGTLTARAGSRKVEAVLRDAKRAGEYPTFQFAKHLKTIAELIRADLGIRIFFTEPSGGGIGGFDNHANQRDNHAAVLRQLSVAIAALVDDLKRDGLLDRVVLMTFSEFGRTLTENGRRGTGHGAAAPIFLAGGKLKGGLVGRHPSLTDLVGDAPKFHTDFRRVYATMLESWLGFDSRAVLGQQFQPLDVFS